MIFTEKKVELNNVELGLFKNYFCVLLPQFKPVNKPRVFQREERGMISRRVKELVNSTWVTSTLYGLITRFLMHLWLYPPFMV